MAAWDGQGRPEWGHGVNRRERRADGTKHVWVYLSRCRVSSLSIDAFTLYVFVSLGSRSQSVSRLRNNGSRRSTAESSFPDIVLSLTLLEPPFHSFLSSFQSAGPPPEKIVTLAGIIAPRMVRRCHRRFFFFFEF